MDKGSDHHEPKDPSLTNKQQGSPSPIREDPKIKNKDIKIDNTTSSSKVDISHCHLNSFSLTQIPKCFHSPKDSTSTH